MASAGRKTSVFPLETPQAGEVNPNRWLVCVLLNRGRRHFLMVDVIIFSIQIDIKKGVSLPISPWNCARSDTLTTLYRDRLGGYLVSTRRWDSNRKKTGISTTIVGFFWGVIGICFNQQKMGWMIFGWKTIGFFPCLPQGPFPCLYPARHDGRGLHGSLEPRNREQKNTLNLGQDGPQFVS